MQRTRVFTLRWALPITLGMCLFAFLANVSSVGALTPIPTPPPKPGSYGLEATKKQAPPTQGATITTPGNGASYSESPITVSGICPTGLLVEVYNNGVMVGAVMCVGGSFTVQVSLFAGTNEINAYVYDDLGQRGPISNTVTVNFTDTSFSAFGELITLTSSYGRRATPAGSELTWPLQLSGGTGPYAFSIDWGDGSKNELKSVALAGVVDISHVYKRAGIYYVNITVTDVNGVSAFLQLVAVSSGQVDGSAQTNEDEDTRVVTKPEILWIPTVIALVLLFPTYWLGRRSMLVSLRHRMLKERDDYEVKQKK